MKRTFFLFILVAALPAWACSCRERPSTKDAWKDSPAVFLGAVEHVERDLEPAEFPGGQSVLVRAGESFKGAKRNQTFRLKQPGYNCGRKFTAGERALFYLHPTGKLDVWVAPDCHRTRSYADAEDDLLFVRGLPASAVGTRLSGSVRDVSEGSRNARSVPGVIVKVRSDNRLVATMTTNANGVFERYGLPAGHYQIDVEAPRRLKIDYFWVSGIRFPLQSGAVYLGADSGVNVDCVLVSDRK